VKLYRKPAKYFWLLLVIFPARIALLAQDADSPAKVPFRVGERLNFSVNWTVGNIGTANLQITAIDTFDSHPCYRVEMEARSNKTLDLIYPVRDYFLSLIDQKELFSRKFVKNQQEGRQKRQIELIYDQQAGLRYDLVKGDTVEIVPEAQDELSIFYYCRTLELKVGSGVLLENFVDKKGNPLKVGILRTEWVEVPAGRFYCYVVEPYIKSGGLFEHKGNLLLWVTNDEHRIPVKISSNLDFGSIVVLLESYSLGAG